MKQAQLIFNQKAGSANAELLPRIITMIKAAGYTIHCEPAETPPSRLSSCETLFVAGGDGTIREVARCLLEKPPRERPPIVLLPLGTANNVASILMPKLTVDHLLENLNYLNTRPFDVGMVSHETGKTFFLEGAGTGLFGSILATYQPEKGKRPLRALTASVETLAMFEAQAINLTFDEKPVQDRFFMLELMNTHSLGYRFKLAPQADCSDGFLNAVLVRESNDTRIMGYLAYLLDGRFHQLPNVETYRFKRATLTLPEGHFHVDAEILEVHGTIHIEVQEAALTFLVPSQL